MINCIQTKEQLKEWIDVGEKNHLEAMQRKEERENNPPECAETCEFKEKFLEAEKLEDSKLKFFDDELVVGDVDTAEYYFSQENLAILIEDKRLQALQIEKEIEKMRKDIEDKEKKLLTIRESIIKLLPIQEEFLKKLFDGSKEK